MERNYLMKTSDYRIDNWVRNTFSVAEEKPTTLPRPEKWYQTVKYWNSMRKGFAVECEIGDESVSEGVAKKYMDDGNLFFKYEKYFTAISHYTLALLLNCSLDLKKRLLHKRSLAYFFTNNFEYSLKDTEELLKMAPSYKDAEERKAKCLFRLGRFEECISCLNDLLIIKDISDLRKLKDDAEKKVKTKDNLTESGKSE